MTKNLDQLRQVAENAAPGPWRKDDRDQVVRRADHLIVYDASCDRMEEWAADTDAQFIATFDPPTVLALIKRVEDAERERDNWRGKYDEAESARTDTDATVQRVSELASEYRKTIPVEVLHSVMVDIRRALGGGDQL